MTKYIAIIQTGEAIKPVLEKYGDFDSFFINNMQVDATKIKTFRVFESLTFPEIDKLAGIIITGSPAMVTDKDDWSEKTIEWLKQFTELNIPVLGVCYGHQMLAHALGGRVDWNPNGRQIGTVKMQLTKEAHTDPIFSSIISANQNAIEFHATHLQSITSLPKDAVLLGSTALDPNHCFRYKNHIWGTQFHPEFNAGIIKEYVNLRSDNIKKEGLNPNNILTENKDNQNGINLLIHFKELCFSA